MSESFKGSLHYAVAKLNCSKIIELITDKKIIGKVSKLLTLFVK